jgi:predicted DNA-binding protein
MIRTQVQLTEEQSRRLHAEARRSGKSVAEIIRRSVDRYLDLGAESGAGNATRMSALEITGRFHSGKSDIADRHDDYLDEAYGR